MNQNPHPAGAAGGATTPAQTQPPAFKKPTGETGPPPAPIEGRFLFLAVALALASGLTLGQKPAGIGLALLGAGLAFSTFTAVPRRDRFGTTCLAAAALLAATPAIRAAVWVQLIALAVALLLAAVGAARAATWRELGAAAWAWVPGVIKSPADVFVQALRRSATQRWGQLGPVLRGAALAGVLLTIFGALFAAADAAFAQAVRHIARWQPSTSTLLIDLLIFVVVLALAGGLRRVAVKRIDRPMRPAAVALGRVEWLIALGSLVVLFAAFVALQLTTLFGGDDHVLRTAGLTYSQYARQGFGQLAVAAALTLLVVAAAARYGPAHDPIIRGLVGVLGLLTLVLLASALHRLGLYEDAYGATRLRFMVHLSLLWLGAVALLVLAAGAASRTAILPRALVLLTAATAIGFVASNPDGRVAQANIDRASDGHTLDTWYLSTMSVDVAPALGELAALPDLRPRTARCVARSLAYDLRAHDPLVSFNLARNRAREQFGDLGKLSNAHGC